MNKRRAPVPFDRVYFKKLAERGTVLSAREVFTHIYSVNHWSGSASVSGSGSDDAQTLEIRKHLRRIIEDCSVRVFLDLPCGDFNWMQSVDLGDVHYIGADIVPGIIAGNAEKHGNVNREFAVLDIINGPLPKADMLFCRDCLVHLSNGDVLKAIDTIRHSGITWLLATTFPECDFNVDIVTGDWRIMNLQVPPFNFPGPLLLLNERCTEGGGTYADKSLGLWRIRDL